MIILAIPVISPIGLPIRISKTTREAYDIVESLKTGAKVLIMSGILPATAPEMYPLTKAVLIHLLRRPVKIIIVTFYVEVPPYIAQLFNEIPDFKNKKYGVDYVFLGFYPGEMTAIASFAKDVRALAKTDYKGTPIDELPIMDGIRTAADFDLFYALVGSRHGDYYIGQVQAPYKVRTILGGQSVNVPEMTIYYASRQAEAIIAGQRGAAEYELLIRVPGEAVTAMDVQSLSHLFAFSLIFVGNVLYLIRRRKQR
jgi:hypothetical protein